MAVLIKVGVPKEEEGEQIVDWAKELGFPKIEIDMGGYTEDTPVAFPNNAVISNCGRVSGVFQDLYKQVVQSPHFRTALTDDKLRLIAALPDSDPDQTVAGVFTWLKRWAIAAKEKFGDEAAIRIVP